MKGSFRKAKAMAINMGYLITIDGLDGSGKSTQSELVAAALAAAGKNVRLISFPNYDSPACAPVKMYLGGEFGTDPDSVNCYAASSFYAVDRCASYLSDWKKNYDAGDIIIASRYTTSNAIHQAAKLGVSERDDFLEWLCDFEYRKLGLPRPDMTVLLDLSVDMSLALISSRGEDTDIHENRDHLEKAHAAATYVADKIGWEKVNCERDGKMRPIADITADILELIEKVIGK